MKIVANRGQKANATLEFRVVIPDSRSAIDGGTLQTTANVMAGATANVTPDVPYTTA
jgi:hypothetical protein